MRTYTSEETARIAGISYRRLDHWCRIGLIAPSVEATGSGTQRGFSEAAVVAVCAVSLLAVENNPSNRIIPKGVFETVLATDFPSDYLVVQGDESAFCSATDVPVLLGRLRRAVVVLPWRVVNDVFLRGADREMAAADV